MIRRLLDWGFYAGLAVILVTWVLSYARPGWVTPPRWWTLLAIGEMAQRASVVGGPMR